MYSLRKRLIAEFFGTFWLVLAGCGSAVLSSGITGASYGYLGIALAFGLSVLTIAYSLGHVSGAHLNPAVTVGLVTARKFPSNEMFPYILAQVFGGIFASAILYGIATGSSSFDVTQGFAANGYAAHSPGGYSMTSSFITEAIMTFTFVTVILGVTGLAAPKGFAPLTIGLCLTLIHLISIPVTNTSVNPARSTGPALFVGDWAFAQLWLFWFAPLLGAYAAGIVYRAWHIGTEQERVPLVTETVGRERILKEVPSQAAAKSGGKTGT